MQTRNLKERKKMRASRYNFFFDAEDGSHLAFNARTGALAVLSPGDHHRVNEILASSEIEEPTTDEEGELWNHLRRGGFVVDDGVDELESLKVRYHLARFGHTHMQLTVLPTLSCNFRCVYCFEERKNVTMSEETQGAILEFVRKKTRNMKRLSVNWYGGEPLLGLKVIRRLHGEFSKICELNGCEYCPGGIVTNGYLLTRDVAKQLREMGIEAAQVTLDGPKEIHDQRRPLANGHGTFDRIVENVAQVADLLKVSIRINTDRTNVSRVLEVLDLLEEKGLKGKVMVYFARVVAETECCADIAGSCLTCQEYSATEVQLIREASKKGFLISKYPYPRSHYCGADQVNSCVVGPDGYVYKCWSDPGNIDEAVGNVQDPEDAHKRNGVKWLAWDVFERSECRECNLLPICLGGCPHRGLRLTSASRGACDGCKHNLLEILKLHYMTRGIREQRSGDAYRGLEGS